MLPIVLIGYKNIYEARRTSHMKTIAKMIKISILQELGRLSGYRYPGLRHGILPLSDFKTTYLGAQMELEHVSEH